MSEFARDYRLIWGVILLAVGIGFGIAGWQTYPGENFERRHNNKYARAYRSLRGGPVVLSKEEHRWKGLGYFTAGSVFGVGGAGLLLLGLADFGPRRRRPDAWTMLEPEDTDENAPSKAVFPSVRWIGYLVLGLIGAEIGAILVALIVAGIAYLTADPLFLLVGFIPYALSIAAWFLIIPPYVLVCAFIGLALSKPSVRAAFRPKLEPESSDLYRRVARLARAAGLDRPPEVGVYQSETPNALATGASRDSGLILFSSGLLEQFTDEEVDAVAAHEVGHLAGGDMLALVLVNSIQNGMSWMMVFYKLRMLVRRSILFVTEIGAMYLSQEREYRADAAAARLTSPEAMIAALSRLGGQPVPVPAEQRGYATLFIRPAFLSTHPSIKDRIAALEERRQLQTVRAASRTEDAAVG